MPRKSVYRAVADIDREALAEFQAGIRKRYTDEQILAELKDCAERLGRSPTMREFAADKQTTVHPQTVICLLYTSPSPRDRQKSRMPSSA